MTKFQEFIKEVKSKFGTTFSIKNPADFTKTKTKLACTCKEHGVFYKTGSKLLVSQGCPKCAILKTRHNKTDTELFIKKARIKHNNKYTYDNCNYLSSRAKIAITCPTHGDFHQRPSDHLQGAGCSKCGRSVADSKRTTSKKLFTKKAASIHASKYQYTLPEKVPLRQKIQIICPIHGSFEQEAMSHLKGCGCPSCATYGYSKEKPGILYYLKVVHNNSTYFKIGITNRSVPYRYNSTDLSKITILHEVCFLKGSDCYNAEQHLLTKYTAYKYTGSEPILSSGNTELLTINILKEVLNVQNT